MSLISIRNQKKREQKLTLNKRYAIGETMGWGRNYRSSDFTVDFEYKVNGTFYKNFILVPSIKNIKTKGGRYMVEFEKGRPGNSRLLLNREVSYSTLQNYNDSGWTGIPAFVILKNADGR